ncbi:hypothetical protein ACTVH1_19000 [Gluconobacter cerinus]
MSVRASDQMTSAPDGAMKDASRGGTWTPGGAGLRTFLGRNPDVLPLAIIQGRQPQSLPGERPDDMSADMREGLADIILAETGLSGDFCGLPEDEPATTYAFFTTEGHRHSRDFPLIPVALNWAFVRGYDIRRCQNLTPVDVAVRRPGACFL